MPRVQGFAVMAGVEATHFLFDANEDDAAPGIDLIPQLETVEAACQQQHTGYLAGYAPARLLIC